MIDYQINPKYKSLEKAILDIPRRFDLEGRFTRSCGIKQTGCILPLSIRNVRAIR